MKALVMKEYGGVFSYEDVETPSAGPDEVLLKIEACAICGSDVLGMNGGERRLPPVIMGHEAAGTVYRVGDNVTSLKVGDRVATQSILHCGECDLCKSGHANLCRNRQVLGVSCREFRRSGGFAEYTTLPARCAHILPDNVSFTHAAMTEPLSIAYHGIALTPLMDDAYYMVLGCGAIGLFAVQILRSKGFKHIIAVDRNPHKLEAALMSGAEFTVNTRIDPDLKKQVLGFTNGLGVYGIIDAMGGMYAFENGYACLSRGGQYTAISGPGGAVSLGAAVLDELAVRGSSNSTPQDFEDSLELIASGRVAPDIVITQTAPLKEGAEWFGHLARKEMELIKVVLIP